MKIDANKIIFFGGTALIITLVVLKIRQDKKNLSAMQYFYENVKPLSND